MEPALENCGTKAIVFVFRELFTSARDLRMKKFDRARFVIKPGRVIRPGQAVEPGLVIRPGRVAKPGRVINVGFSFVSRSIMGVAK